MRHDQPDTVIPANASTMLSVRIWYCAEMSINIQQLQLQVNFQMDYLNVKTQSLQKQAG
jgi:hypothetical protein